MTMATATDAHATLQPPLDGAPPQAFHHRRRAPPPPPPAVGNPRYRITHTSDIASYGFCYERRPSAELFPDPLLVGAVTAEAADGAAAVAQKSASGTSHSAAASTVGTSDRLVHVSAFAVAAGAACARADGGAPVRRPLAEKLDRLLFFLLGQLGVAGKGFIAGGSKKGRTRMVGKYLTRQQLRMLGKA